MFGMKSRCPGASRIVITLCGVFNVCNAMSIVMPLSSYGNVSDNHGLLSIYHLPLALLLRAVELPSPAEATLPNFRTPALISNAPLLVHPS